MTALPQFALGFRLFTGEAINAVVNVVNNLTGNGTPQAITGTTGTFSGAFSAGSTISNTPQTLTAAGATQGTATAITTFNAIVTVALTASTKGVKLPTAVTGLCVRVANLATFGVKVYPATNGKIGAAATNVADTVLAINKANEYIALNTTRWAVLRGA